LDHMRGLLTGVGNVSAFDVTPKVGGSAKTRPVTKPPLGRGYGSPGLRTKDKAPSTTSPKDEKAVETVPSSLPSAHNAKFLYAFQRSPEALLFKYQDKEITCDRSKYDWLYGLAFNPQHKYPPTFTDFNVLHNLHPDIVMAKMHCQ